MHFDLRPCRCLCQLCAAGIVALPREAGFNLNLAGCEQYGSVGKSRAIRGVADGRLRLLRRCRNGDKSRHCDCRQSTPHRTSQVQAQPCAIVRY